MIKKIIVVITLFISVVSIAQKNNTSAYSFFGIGDKNNSSTVEQLSMGGVGVTLAESYRLNLLNPASNASLRLTTYSLALENKNTRAKDSNDKQRAAATYLSYLAMGIPLGEKGGLVFGLLPNSTVGYSLLSNKYEGDETIEASLYEGEGGTNKVFLGVGYKIFKGFSFGLQGNYVFGKIENSILNQVKDASLATKYKTESNVDGFSLNAGIQYKTTLKNKLNLHIGGAFEFGNEINAEGNEYLYSVILSNSESPRDTILNKKSDGKLKSPLKTTLGVGIGKQDKWYAGVDYSFQNALELKGDVFDNFSKTDYDNYSKVSVGGFYTPKINSITSYWERVTYRAGFKFENTGLLVDSSGNGTDFTSIKDFGISFGVGLPVTKQLSSLNFGFEFGKRGKATKGLVEENYFNFRLSLSLNDKWFNKRQIF
ncbi:hypothetical protein [Lutibacter sp. B1]|uniref:hypothetical protein n=1 Tax=Lutibacter sp. B1 TaxID=2725996 RepID=UPI001456DC20|nr:hypothetical protein [Lutibacter sp. B1]NLP58920.1 hypothetical protein [Lutibacter sp. B1]